LTEKIKEAITLAKSFNKKVLFDIDDLIFDMKYTNKIPFIKALSSKEKRLFVDDVVKLGETLKLCDGVITTTEALAKELKHYISNVFINRNSASEEMWQLSQEALINKNDKNNKNNSENIIIGFFSSNRVHDSDLDMIKPVLLKILREYKNVQLLLLGDINFPSFLEEFSSQVIIKKFSNWEKLPKIISNIDINIVPLKKTIFNKVKSENKWLEAALVKVPTIASNFGAFKEVIKHNETGILCSDLNEWYLSIKFLIINRKFRKILGDNAYHICKGKYNTLNKENKFANYINLITNKHIGFYLPTLRMYGGIYVVLKHAIILKSIGWDVDLILPEEKIDSYIFQGIKFNVINLKESSIIAQYDIIVATFFATLYSILNYYKTKKHLYLIQSYETNFFPYGNNMRSYAEKTYSLTYGIEYITISKWCENWLLNKYKQKCRYAPNGIDFDSNNHYMRNLNKKIIRILIEGDCASHYKNVDESFKIAEKLDKNRFEIWYLSNSGKPKKWYKMDKYFYQVPHEKVKEIYYECDILLKSSWFESFSYPPLEMMATGGYSIVVPNEGNKEYLIDEKNCLFYRLGDLDSAIQNINRLISDKKLQQYLYENGLITAKNRDWKKFKNKIIKLYDS